MNTSRTTRTLPTRIPSLRAGRGLQSTRWSWSASIKVISPLVKNGQSIHHVLMNNADELMVSEKTAYNYLNAGLFDADKMDCPRIVRMRPRRSCAEAENR